MASGEQLKKVAYGHVDRIEDPLHQLSQSIYTHPELAFKEVFAHETLTAFLEEQGFAVERHYKMDTAFRAEYGTGLPHVAVMCEYDALPEIGHACAHNIIAEMAVGAGCAIKAALEHAGKPMGKVTVLGTPAEEGGGGKIELLKMGAFKGVSAALMAHPYFGNRATAPYLCSEELRVTFHGKASHAAAFPWEGVNALDAAVMAYSAISCLRQQLKPTCRVMGVITNGGAKPNIIPEEASLWYSVRAPTVADHSELKVRVAACMEAAAKATGCTVDCKFSGQSYYDVIYNRTLVDLYEKNSEGLGIQFVHDMVGGRTAGSTDMGNVSYVVPAIHPHFHIGEAKLHTRDFQKVAGTPEAHGHALTQAKVIAATALDIFTNPELADKMAAEHKDELDRRGYTG